MPYPHSEIEQKWQSFWKNHDTFATMNPAKKSVLILHGWWGHSQWWWRPWLKKNLEQKGYLVYCPDLPGSDTPDLDIQLNFLENYLNVLDSDSIIIGHSLGGMLAQHFLQKYEKKIDTLFLIGPAYPWLEKDRDLSYKKGLNEAMTQLIPAPECKKFVEKISIYLSTDDTHIPYESAKKYYESYGEIRTFTDRGHFNEKNNILELPELYEEIIAHEKPKYYALDMFPYPSGAGLHVWHPKWYTATDIIARYKHARWFHVLHPMGWDAFGLPAENYAIKTGTHPAITTANNINRFREQLQKFGFSFDWNREIDTTNPDYYKWSQWIFLKLFEAWLAYESDKPINFCPSCKTGLANEEVVDGKCERCGTSVEKKAIRQWILAITKYADRLLSDIDRLDWPKGIKEMQRNWIGRSEGINISYKMVEVDEEIVCYTTRPDTNFGMTFLTLAPEHPLIEKYLDQFPYADNVRNYIESVKNKSDFDRAAGERIKTGVLTGFHVTNQLTNKTIPVYVWDFVLVHVGTGALIGVPGHDVRDFEFAQVMNIPVKRVVVAPDGDTSEIIRKEQVQEDAGVMINSGFLDGLDIMDAKEKIMDHFEQEWYGKRVVNYKLRDWIFSRQRYWGEPIPLIHIKDEDYQKLPIISEKEDIPYITLTGKSKPKTDNNIKKFSPVNAIIRHWEKDQFIVLTFKNWDKWLVWGSVEEWESRENAIIREVQEETGYKNVSIEKIIIEDIYSRGYKERKDLEEEARESIYVVKILNDEQISRGSEEGIIDMEWVDWINVANKITLDHHKFYWDYFYYKNFAYRVEKNGKEYLYISGKEVSQIYNGLSGKIIIETKLPLKLPEVEKYEPSGDGQSPLSTIPKWVNVELGNNLTGQRETNTMPQWAGSCWYYLRFMDPTNNEAIVDPAIVKYWGEADSYIGGAEHAVLHLLYARFWHKFLFDIGVVPTDEPFYRLRNVGLILGPDGNKMSKSKGNVINPDDVIGEYGADTLRLYEMSMADFSDVSPWNTKAIVWSYRLLEKIHKIFSQNSEISEVPNFSSENDDLKKMKLMHKTIKKVWEDIENMKFNTAIAAINIMVNEGMPTDPENAHEWKSTLARLLSPFAPHLAEECWELMKYKGQNTKDKIFEHSIYYAPWPEYNLALTIDDEVQIAIQINGKLRGTYAFMRGVTAEEVRMTVEHKPEIAKWLEWTTVIKEVFIPNKILNIVIQ